MKSIDNSSTTDTKKFETRGNGPGKPTLSGKQLESVDARYPCRSQKISRREGQDLFDTRPENSVKNILKITTIIKRSK